VNLLIFDCIPHGKPGGMSPALQAAFDATCGTDVTNKTLCDACLQKQYTKRTLGRANCSAAVARDFCS
jgi:hypothetical protein